MIENIYSENVRIYARVKPINHQTEWFEIKDLYWFEEQGIHDFDGVNHLNERFEFGIELLGD